MRGSLGFALLLRAASRALRAPAPSQFLSTSPRKRARRADALAPAASSSPASDARPAPPRRFSVALVGRPNVGKSSLFNRLAQQRLAIVNAQAGTTRDWKEADARLGSLEFVVMDTGGLEDRGARGGLEDKMLRHTEAAIARADAVLFVVDARSGVSEDDAHFARWVKRLRAEAAGGAGGGRGVHLVVNKAERWLNALTAGQGDEDEWRELERSCYALRLGGPVPIAAEQGEGLLDLYRVLEPYGAQTSAPGAAKVASDLPRSGGVGGIRSTDLELDGQRGRGRKRRAVRSPAVLEAAAPRGGDLVPGNLFVDAPPPTGALPSELHPHVMARLARAAGPVQLAIVGRPNVGKSTLVNQIVGEDRVLTGPTPGLTRDSTRVSVEVDVGADATAAPAAGSSPASVAVGTRRLVQIVDTAGMRRSGAMDLSTPLEGMAVGAAKKAISSANVVAIVVDGSGGNSAGLTNEPISFAKGGSERNAASLTSSPKTSDLGSSTKAPPTLPHVTRDANGEKPRTTRAPGDSGSAFGLTLQDLSILQQVMDEGRGAVIVVNKMDATPNAAGVIEVVRRQLAAAPAGKGAEIVPVSALRGRGLEGLMPAVLRTFDRWNRRISTGRLNQWLQLVSRHHPPPSVTRITSSSGRGRRRGGTWPRPSTSSKASASKAPAGGAVGRGRPTTTTAPLRVRLKYVTQINARPPTFALFANRRDVPEAYQRYLQRSLADEFDLGGVPVRLLLRAADNPFRRGARLAAARLASSTTVRVRGPRRRRASSDVSASSRATPAPAAHQETGDQSKTTPRGSSRFGARRTEEEERALLKIAQRAKRQGGSLRPFSRKDRRVLDEARGVHAARAARR